MWYQWITGFLGLWIVVLGIAGNAFSWPLVITGIIISVLGFWSAWRDPNEIVDKNTIYRRDINAYL